MLNMALPSGPREDSVSSVFLPLLVLVLAAVIVCLAHVLRQRRQPPPPERRDMAQNTDLVLTNNLSAESLTLSTSLSTERFSDAEDEWPEEMQVNHGNSVKHQIFTNAVIQKEFNLISLSIIHLLYLHIIHCSNFETLN
jgi:hypothetical protein